MMPTYITPGTSHHERARLFGEALRMPPDLPPAEDFDDIPF